MLDLAQDLPSEKPVEQTGMHDTQRPSQGSKPNKKRKREELEAEKLRKRESGAGGPVPLPESYVGIGSHIRKFTSSKQDEWQMVQLDQTPSRASDDDEDLGLGASSLAHLRRRVKEENAEDLPVKGRMKHQVNGVASHSQEASQSTMSQVNKGSKSAWFLSLQYRSILGIVPIGGPDDEDSEIPSEQVYDTAAPQSGLEVAVIERPLWDVDLPPRFDGGQDWET